MNFILQKLAPGRVVQLKKTGQLVREEFLAVVAAEEKNAEQAAAAADNSASRQSLQTSLAESRYQYHPLETTQREIRVLLLRPAENAEDPIEATFRVGRVDDWPIHNCLSYVWGRQPPDRVMRLDGRPFEITAHLERALQRYRSLLGSQQQVCAIWVDAICINQADNAEKAQQVGIMRQIYERGKCTPDGPSLRTLALLEPGNRQPDSSREVYTDRGEAMQMWRAHGIDAAEAISAVVEMLAKPWFRRVWVIQEGSHSLHVQMLYGDVCVRLLCIAALQKGWGRSNVLTDQTDRSVVNDMNDVARALMTMTRIHRSWMIQEPAFRREALDRHLESLQEVVKDAPDGDRYRFVKSNGILRVERVDDGSLVNEFDNPWATPEFVERDIEIEVVPYRLLDLLDDFRFTGATNKRDKLYALLGLASDAFDAPAVDYSLSEEDVFLQYAVYFIRGGDGMNLLQQAAEDPREHRLSWVPTWFEPELRRHAYHFEVDEIAGPRACGDLEPLVWVDDISPATCVIHGRIIDTIATVSGVPVFRGVQAQSLSWKWLGRPVANLFQSICELAKLVLYDHHGEVILYDWQDATADDRVHRNIHRFDEPLRTKLLSTLAKLTDHFVKLKFWGLYEDDKSGTNLVEAEDAEAHALARDPLEAMFRFLFDPSQMSTSYLGSLDKESIKFPYRSTVPRLLHGRRICFTAGGHMDVVPSMARSGDAIAVVAGASMPFVLRETADGSGGFLLRGEGYLRGFMHGEGASASGMRNIRLV